MELRKTQESDKIMRDFVEEHVLIGVEALKLIIDKNDDGETFEIRPGVIMAKKDTNQHFFAILQDIRNKVFKPVYL